METLTAPEIDLSERLKISGPLLLRGRNPRKEFDPAYMAWLKSSIKAQGILQDPLVRRLADGSLELVAGECRIINWIELYGEEPLFVKVKEMTDAEARAASLTENVIRKAMSPVEEAEAAALTLGDCNNDRDDAARYLGWKRDMLDNRLALMYAIEPVRDALKAKKIALGHAELLATCRKEAQENALGLLLGQERIMPVTEFKAFLERAALVLDTAIFDKTQCAGCHQNSSNQSALFAEAISGGKCTNKACFDGKTEAELDARKVKLSEDYQVVRIVRAGENLTVVRLTADGPKGVGAEQAMACRTCANFGAVVSAVPDKMGIEYRDMCMDVPCNVRKVYDTVSKIASHR